MKLQIVITLLFAGLISSALGQHPKGGEHPTAAGNPSQAPNPGTAARAPKKTATMTDISAGIKSHIAAESKKAPDGKFHFKHDGKDLALALSKVHEDRLSSVGAGKYFACVDMKAADNTVYDLDFFLTGGPGAMKVVETTVHKVSGKALYNWEEKGGIWRKVAAKA